MHTTDTASPIAGPAIPALRAEALLMAIVADEVRPRIDGITAFSTWPLPVRGAAGAPGPGPRPDARPDQ